MNIYVTVWDQDPQNRRVPYDQIDEFNFEYYNAKDGNLYVVTQRGLRTKEPTV